MSIESVHIMPIVGEKPSQYAERLGREYADTSFQKDKKHKGQFFTPLAISRFMGDLAIPPGKKSVSVLDPGCGLAILSCSLIEHLVESSCPDRISLSLYETDKNVVHLTEQVLSYLYQYCEGLGVSLYYQLNKTDFVLEKCECLDEDDSLWGGVSLTDKFDYIISNPPYFKLAKDDIHTRSCASIVDGQTNIYALFMAICSKMLEDDGQMIFITPRSFGSSANPGVYAYEHCQSREIALNPTITWRHRMAFRHFWRMCRRQVPSI